MTIFVIGEDRWDEVESVCEKILENEPNDISTLLALARACEMNKKSDKALKMITKALTLAPNEAKVWAQGIHTLTDSLSLFFLMDHIHEKILLLMSMMKVEHCS
jgi:tetratricopeptide (TPR) repeat protein